MSSIKKLINFMFLMFACATVTYAANMRPQLYVFVSFSMPDESLTAYMKDAHQVGGALVLQGLYHNSFSATTQKVIQLLPKKQGGLLLDPNLFRRFKIKKVPAILMTDKACLDEATCDRYAVIYGNITLSYALQEIASRDQNYADAANALLAKLKDPR